MAHLSVSLLGTFEVTLKGQPVTTFESNKVRALLAYLAVESSQPHHRETLAGLLWPEHTERRARRNLSQTLSNLRQSIGDGDVSPPYLLVTSQTLQFNPLSDHTIDASSFAALVNNCHSHNHPNLNTCQSCIAQLKEAATLYRGDFLAELSLPDGAAFEEWTLLKREWLRCEMMQALYHLANHYRQQGDYEAAYPYAWRQVEMDSLREEAYQQLMRILALSGRRSEALAQYDACCRVLAEELGVEPAEETTALYQNILNGNLDKLERACTEIPTTFLHSPAFLKDEQEELIMAERSIFVARERELTQLNQFLQTTLAGHGQVVLVTGEAGSGKTTLINEFARRAQISHSNLIVATGVGNAYTGIGDPYLPFREIMRMLTGDIESQWIAGIITRDHALRLWHLMPHAILALIHSGPALINTFVAGEALLSRAVVYEARKSDLPDKAEWMSRLRELTAQRPAQSADQNRIFEEFTNVLNELARRQSLLLILDDLHWADVSSISLLFHLSRQIAESSILIVGSYRPEEVARRKDEPQHPLADVLSELKRHFGDIWVNLDQAEQAEGRAFVDAFLDTEPNQLGENFRRALARQTEGHPLFTVELIRDMQERGDLQQNKDGRWIERKNLTWTSMPVRVEGVIEKRMGRLNAEQQEILKVACVEGEIFTAEVAACVRACNEQDLIRHLSNELDRQHHLVNALGVQYLDSQRLSRYRFRHNLFQKYLYHSLDEIEKAHLNEAVGSALEALYGGQAQEEIAVVAGQLARHFEAAGQVSKAINYLQLAGDAAACLYACAEAIAYYRRALKLIQHSQVSDSQISHLFSHLGRVLELDSQFEQALAYYEKMEQLAKQCGDCAMELAALIARINLLAVPTPVHDPAQGRILGEKALTLARELGDKEAEAKILWDLLNACQYTTGGLSQAIAYGEHALALARELDLHEQMAYTLTDISYCYWESFRFDQARRSLHEAEKLWREIGNLPMLANSLSTACQISVSAGTFDEALTYSEEAYHISKSIDNLWGQSFSRMVIGNVYWERGLPEQAIAMMKNSICLGKKAGFVVPQIITRSDLALMYGDLGMLTQGLEIAQLALSIAKKKFPIFCIIPLGMLARLHLRNGNFAKAEEAINAGKNDPSLETFPIEFIPIYLAEAELALAQDNYQYVLDLTSNMLTDMRQCDMRYYIPHVLYLQSQALIALEQPGTARASLLEACKLAEALNARRALWPILFTLSQLETEPAESECLRRQAQKIIEYIAAHTGTPELRDSFLGLTNVQVVFEPSSL